ncbi:MAG: hypothetical protein L3J91_03780 [Thermoplasmata archaeon]|nr:hypothetical protein [Thermoplasmata archaeon]
MVPAAWDDREIDWSEFAAVVIRSTWGYDRRVAEFREWVERVGQASVLWNAPELVRWNLHKGYLVELARKGFDVVPTELVPSGSGRTLASVRAEHGWSDVVVKPAVGANSARLRVTTGSDLPAGEAHLVSLLDEGDAIVQPRLRRVDEVGERSLIFLDGTFSHAVEYPFVLRRDARADATPSTTPGLAATAGRIIAALPVRPLYARADFLPRDSDGWWLNELELIEPLLYLRTNPDAPGRLARAISAWLDRARRA